MTDYSSVAPPATTTYDPSSMFQDALQRARLIAAKIHTPEEQAAAAAAAANADQTKTSQGSTPKRPLEEANGEESDKKRLASENDPFGAQLAAIKQQAAAMQQGGLGQPRHMGLGAVTTEEISVPDGMVGLLIGRGGEQISRLQAESGVKIQISPDSGGAPVRNCTLTGSPDAIAKCRSMIDEIVSKANAAPPGYGGGGGMGMMGNQTMEVMIPASKVGLVIGKGGETIKSLQEKAGVKMVMIQDGPAANAPEKPLRITGDPMKVQRAHDMVMDLLASKDMGRDNFGGGEYGGGGPGRKEVTVPQFAVGVVIGKGGEMIKKIQSESGCRLQFKQDDGSLMNGERICMLMGNPENINEASRMLHEIIQGASDRQGGPGGRGGPGRGRGRGWGQGPPGGFGGNFGEGFQDQITYSIPANKCGLVIGKGGETIRTINQTSGAHVELDRRPPPNPNEKVFIIRGNPEEIHHAQTLIAEKCGIPPPAGPPGGGGPGRPGGYGDHGGPPQHQQPGMQQGFAPQGWGSGYPMPAASQSQWGQQPNDQTTHDPNAQAWAAYYQNYGQQNNASDASLNAQPTMTQQGQHDYSAAWADYFKKQQEMAAVSQRNGGPDYSQAWAEYFKQQQQQQQQQQPGGQAATQASVQQQAQPTSQAQPDYSAQWAEWYRQQGLYYGQAQGQAQVAPQ